MADADRPAAAGSDPDQSLVLTRAFDARREAVFRAWTDPAQVARWLGPRTVKADVKTMDPRPGGNYRIAMHRADGGVSTVQGTYREVVPPERLSFTWAWEDEAGKPGHETVVTVTFREIGNRTELTLRHELFDTRAARDDHGQGWTASFDTMTEVLAGRTGKA